MAQGRRVRRVVRKIDTWSVLKVSALFWLSVVLIMLTAGVLLWAAAAIGLLLLLGACAPNATQDSLQPKGPYADKLQDLFVPVFWVAVFVFVFSEDTIDSSQLEGTGGHERSQTNLLRRRVT